MPLTGRHLLLGVTGGVAAFKAAELLRRLREAGAAVEVVMTAGAQRFVTPLTFTALAGRPVHTDLFDAESEAVYGHLALARWADAVLIAPASADFLARLAHGRADDLLAAVCLATRAPLAVAPAMNTAMWEHPATQTNATALKQRGVTFFGPEAGELACGEVGAGRMAEPEALVTALEAWLASRSTGAPSGPLAGLNALVTAGPTREPLDPVRFLGNRSSGRMGFAVARALAAAGARVTLIAGPVAQPTPPGVTRIDVETARGMHAAVLERLDRCAIFVAVAAVADFRPAEPAGRKLKKSTAPAEIRLIANPDILADVARRPQRPFTVGFAAETERVAANARGKLAAKGLDMIAANAVGKDGTGFEAEDNALHVLWTGGGTFLPRAPKEEIARALVGLITERYRARTTQGSTENRRPSRRR